MAKNAIVIFYEGKPVDIAVATQLTGALATLLNEGESEPTIKYFSEEDLSKEILKASIPPKQSTEDGDSSVKVIIGMIPTSVLENRTLLTVALTKQLVASEKSDDAKYHAFSRAMSYIAQGMPVSTKVANEYHFTKMVREVVTEVYKSYINM